MKKLISVSAFTAVLLASSLNAFGLFDVDINQKIAHNQEIIKEYKEAIAKLEKQNKFMQDEIAKNPQLYVKKPLYENQKDKYIYRIKLNGAKAQSLNFLIKDSVASVKMDMQHEEKDDNGYFYSSQYFSTSYTIPADVAQDKITHKVDGDYFVIEMPKKKVKS
jgi:HSP20 family molecular chaperone IbpA